MYIGYTCIGSQVHGRRVMSSTCNVTSQHIQELLDVYYKIKMWNQMVSKKKNRPFCVRVG